MGFIRAFSSCLGILVGAVVLAAAQISCGRYMKVILVMVWVGFVDLD